MSQNFNKEVVQDTLETKIPEILAEVEENLTEIIRKTGYGRIEIIVDPEKIDLVSSKRKRHLGKILDSL